jgi:hypothetical protein
MYACMYVCLYICICGDDDDSTLLSSVCIYVVCVCVCDVWVCVCIYAIRYACMSARMYACMYMYICGDNGNSTLLSAVYVCVCVLCVYI